MDAKKHREILDRAMARARARDEQLSAEFRERLAEAPNGWLPPAEEREEINEEVLQKCLGITQQERRSLTNDQLLEIAVCWFAGDEAQIPYEDWELTRPTWLS